MPRKSKNNPLSDDAMAVLVFLACEGHAVVRDLAVDAFGKATGANTRRVRLALAEIGKWCGGVRPVYGTGIKCSNGLYHDYDFTQKWGNKHRWGLKRESYEVAIVFSLVHKLK